MRTKVDGGLERGNLSAALLRTNRGLTHVNVLGISVGPPVWWLPRCFWDNGPTRGGHRCKRLNLGWLVFALRLQRGYVE